MARTRPHRIDVDEHPGGTGPDDVPTTTLADRGHALMDRMPLVADGARTTLAGLEARLDELSDTSVTAVSGFALGLTSGLIIAGMPRVAVILSMVPAAMALRSAMARGFRTPALVN